MTYVLEAHIRITLTGPMAVLSVSDGIDALLGFKADDFLAGKVSLQARIHADDQDIADDLFSTKINSTFGAFNIRLRQANGRIRCVKCHYTKVPDTASNGVILELLLQDAKSLQHLTDQPIMPNFKAMMENTDDYIYFKDRNHVFTGASQTLVTITSPSEHWTDLLGQTDYDVFPEEYADIYYRLEKQVFAGIHVAHEIQETLDQDGNKGWVDNRKYPIQDENGEIIGLFGIARIITEQKLAEQALRESEESLRNAQIIAGLGNYVLDIQSGTWKSSDVLDQLFGIDKTYKHSYEGWLTLIHPDDRTKVDDYISSGILGQRPIFDNEFRIIRHADQTERWVHGLGKLEFDAQGRPLKIRGTIQDITERRQELLAEQRTILGNRLVGIITVLERRVVWANTAFENMLGYGTGELIGMPTRQFYVNEEDYLSMVATSANIKDDGIMHIEYEFARKDGRHIWVNMSAAPLHKETGELLWTLIDVTERKLAENELLESEHKLSNILDSVDACIYLKDTQSRYLFANRSVCELFGASMEEIVGQSDETFIGAETIEQLRNNDRLVLDKGKTIKTEDTIRNLKDGQNSTYLSVKLPLRNEAGEIYALCGISTDITERKLTEDYIRIAAIVFESQEGMLVTDANSVILRVNRAFTHITGYTTEEAIGKTPLLLKSGRHDAAFYASMWDDINNMGVWEGEIWNRRKNGEVFPNHLAITAVKDLNGTVTNYVTTFTDITVSKAAAEEIRSLAFYDPLTGLPNRRLLVDRLNQALVCNARSCRDGALLFLDIDHFKTLNDTLGHDIGDLLLQQVAERLTACVREGDTVSRLGGDEFVVMLEDLSEQTINAALQAEVVGEKILTTLNHPYRLGTHEYRSTTSIGVALFSNHQSQEELLRHADIAMYQAKKAGRNTMRFFDPQMQDAINALADIERELHKALGNQQFQLHYQIQVDDSGRPTGAEALIRWLHPERGLVSPFYFIPLAEETGLILPIGQWVVETACAQLKAWQHAVLTRDLVLSINVSAKQFRQADFVAQVHAAVQRYAINPMQLKLELTESMLLEHIDDTIVTMNALKEMGIQFSLDDFGTGYSSLQYIKRLPLYQLKIDQSFVRDIAVDSSDQAIVCTIIAMAHALNLNVIAEGVETEEQRQFLLNSGCTHYQGYLFSKPIPIEQFETLLKQGDCI